MATIYFNVRPQVVVGNVGHNIILECNRVYINIFKMSFKLINYIYLHKIHMIIFENRYTHTPEAYNLATPTSIGK